MGRARADERTLPRRRARATGDDAGAPTPGSPKLAVETMAIFFKTLHAGAGGLPPDLRQELQVVAAAAKSPLENLADHTVDLIILSGENAVSRLETIHLFDDELQFIMPPDHPLVGKSHIEGQDIVGEDFITYTRIPEPDREYAKLFRPNDTYPNWTETVELPEAIVEMVAAGLGTSVLAGWAVGGAIRSGRIVGRRVGPDGVSIPWYAVIRPDTALEDQITRDVAGALAMWCRETDGFRT